MEKQFLDLFAVNRFSSGRRISLFNQVEQTAQTRGETAIALYARQAITHDAVTRELDDRWAKPERRALYSPEVTALDQQIDPMLTQFRNVSAEHTADLPEDHPQRVRVTEMLDDIFPAGVKAITSLPCIDQAAAIENILLKLQGPFAPVVDDLALTRKVARLADLTRAYREAIDHASGPLSYDTVRQARSRGHAYLVELIAMIIGRFHNSDDPAHQAAREAFLRPIIAHNEIVREQHRRRRARGRTDNAAPNTERDAFDIDDIDATAAKPESKSVPASDPAATPAP